MADEVKNLAGDLERGAEVDVVAPTGMVTKILTTVIIILVLIGGGVAIYLFLLKPDWERKAKLAEHEKFMAEYSRIKSVGYDDFWKCVFPLATEEQANTNLKLESLIKGAIAQNEEVFGKHIGSCLEKLKNHVVAARDLKGPPEYTASLKDLPVVLQALYDAWSALSEEFSKAGERHRWDSRLDEVTSKGWGQMYVDHVKRQKSTDETLRNARRYMKFVTCSVGKTYSEMGNTAREVEETLVRTVLGDLCSTPEKAIERSRYIESTCVQNLVAPEPPPPDADWRHVQRRALYYETRSLAVIAGSLDGEEGCWRKARRERERIMVANLFNAWVAYKKTARGIEEIFFDASKKLKGR